MPVFINFLHCVSSPLTTVFVRYGLHFCSWIHPAHQYQINYFELSERHKPVEYKKLEETSVHLLKPEFFFHLLSQMLCLALLRDSLEALLVGTSSLQVFTYLFLLLGMFFPRLFSQPFTSSLLRCHLSMRLELLECCHYSMSLATSSHSTLSS